MTFCVIYFKGVLLVNLSANVIPITTNIPMQISLESLGMFVGDYAVRVDTP
jgi:hypothetical protein